MNNLYNICVLSPEIHDTISQEIISGILNRGYSLGVNTTIISAGRVKAKGGNFNNNIELYTNVLKNEMFHGIIVLAGHMSNFATKEELVLFLKSLPQNIPLVNLSVKVPGYTSILIDNISPIENIVNHLIVEHKKKRIMFIKGGYGQSEAEDRFSGYKKALEYNNIPLNDDYVYQGDFTPQKGIMAVKYFLGNGHDQPDAIVCANDDTALGVYAELKRHNIKIGFEGVAVTGFDNIGYTKFMEPCLTTVNQPFNHKGWIAVDTLLSIIKGIKVQDEYFQPKIIYRQSCGCRISEDSYNSDRGDDFIDVLTGKLEDIQIEGLEQDISDIADKISKFVKNREYDFTKDLEEYVTRYRDKGYNLMTLIEILKLLNNRFIPLLDRDGVFEYYKQMNIINSHMVNVVSSEKAREFQNFNEQNSELDSILIELASCMSYESLEESLSRNFFYLGIKELSIVFKDSTNLYLMELSQKKFTKDNALNRSWKNYCSLYLPVTSKNDLGYCRFKIMLNSFHIGEVLSFQISRAIYLIELFDSLNDKIKEIEHSYQDLRTTKDLLMENEQLANLGGLVAGFTHEISTPIGVGVTAASHLLDEVKIFNNLFKDNNLKRTDVSNFINQTEDIVKIIMNNLNRTSTLINGFKQISVDQASDVKRRFELGSYLKEVVHSLSPILKRGRHRVMVDVIEAIYLDSYPGAISQIITNLIQNSIKHGFENIFNGEITVKVREENHYITIYYHDNGCGIDKEKQEIIFNSYYSTKIGYGGSGLGLSIIKKLTIDKLLGTISCTGEESEGASFIITLPN